MKVKFFATLMGLLVLIVVLELQTSHAATERFCPSGEEGRRIFNSGELTDRPGYFESAGSRVQREHPNTHIFGHAKFYGFMNQVSCTYSNHVGLVFVVRKFGVTQRKSDFCDDETCRIRPHWRSEWMRSKPEQDQKEMTHLDVCVVERDGLDHPSTECAFVELDD